MKIEYQEPDGIGETPFIQSIKSITIDGVTYTKAEIMEYIRNKEVQDGNKDMQRL